MTDPSETTTSACHWRIGEWCLYRVKHRLHDAEDISVSDGADLSAFADMLRRTGKNGPRPEDLRCQAATGLRCHYAPPMPNYDGQLRELSVAGTMLHRFAPQARNMIAVLTAFQAQGWPRWIADPLGNGPESDFEKHLHDTVSALNHAQKPRLIHFSSTGADRTIRWDFVSRQE
jgi:hypothetical protein